MSERSEEGGTATLEELFLSREFGRSPARLPSVEFGPARTPRSALAAAPGRSSPSGHDAAPDAVRRTYLEEVFLSERFGKTHRLASATTEDGELVESVIVPLRPLPLESTRYRAVAAASGVAAAALVIAGMASGSGQPTSTSIAAAGRPTSPHNGGDARSGAPVRGPAGAPPAASETTVSAGNAANGLGAGATVAADVVAASTPGTVATVAPPGLSADGGAGGTITPAPPGATPATPAGSAPGPGAASGLSNVTTTLGSTVSTVGTTTTATANQLASTVPPAAPVTAVVDGVGGTVTTLGQALGLTTT
jgi:hypothetical protein